MRFNNERAIFLQISDHLTHEIITGRLAPNERLPSARELAASLEVNPNTAARALQELADAGVARCERGTGYFVAKDGATKARENFRDYFYKSELPGLFRTMTELGISVDEIGTCYKAWLKTTVKGNP
jgi:GntR family transcriptional regulator